VDSLHLGRAVSKLRKEPYPDAAIPSLAAQRTYTLPYEVNLKMWQFSFNVLLELPDVLTKGRERELFKWTI
jgi:microsomal epoxide hydrolase